MIPDRSREIQHIFRPYQDWYRAHPTDDERRLMLPVFCRELNRAEPEGDDGWGVLVKNDHPIRRFIPYDVLVWKPTLEHVDVLSATGPVWIEHGPIRRTWEWQSAKGLPEPPEPSIPLPDRPPTPDIPVKPPHPLWELVNDLQREHRILKELFTRQTEQLSILQRTVDELRIQFKQDFALSTNRVWGHAHTLRFRL